MVHQQLRAHFEPRLLNVRLQVRRRVLDQSARRIVKIAIVAVGVERVDRHFFELFDLDGCGASFYHGEGLLIYEEFAW